MRRFILGVIGVITVLIIAVMVSAIAFYMVAFAGHKALVDDEPVGPAFTIIDGFVAVYLVPTDTGALLIDAGNDPSAAAITAALAKHGLSLSDVKAVFLTHGHGDHIGAVPAIHAPIYAMGEEVGIVSGAVAPRGFLASLGSNDGVAQVTDPLTDGQTVTIDGVDVTAFLIPGHTVGSAAFVVGDAVFLGDTANANTDGSLDGAVGLFSDDADLAATSLRALPARLPPQVQTVGFGHSGPTTIDALGRF